MEARSTDRSRVKRRAEESLDLTSEDEDNYELFDEYDDKNEEVNEGAYLDHRAHRSSSKRRRTNRDESSVTASIGSFANSTASVTAEPTAAHANDVSASKAITTTNDTSPRRAVISNAIAFDDRSSVVSIRSENDESANPLALSSSGPGKSPTISVKRVSARYDTRIVFAFDEALTRGSFLYFALWFRSYLVQCDLPGCIVVVGMSRSSGRRRRRRRGFAPSTTAASDTDNGNAIAPDALVDSYGVDDIANDTNDERTIDLGEPVPYVTIDPNDEHPNFELKRRLCYPAIIILVTMQASRLELTLACDGRIVIRARDSMQRTRNNVAAILHQVNRAYLHDLYDSYNDPYDHRYGVRTNGVGRVSRDSEEWSRDDADGDDSEDAATDFCCSEHCVTGGTCCPSKITTTFERRIDDSNALAATAEAADRRARAEEENNRRHWSSVPMREVRADELDDERSEHRFSFDSRGISDRVVILSNGSSAAAGGDSVTMDAAMTHTHSTNYVRVVHGDRLDPMKVPSSLLAAMVERNL